MAYNWLMLGNNIIDFLDQLNPEELGTFLILSSAGYQRLIERIRKKHELNPDSDGYSKEADIKLMMIGKIPEEKILLYDFYIRNKIEVNEEKLGGWIKQIKLKKEISDVLDHIPVKRDVLFRSLSGYPMNRILSAYGLPIYHGPISEEGYFIRVTPWTHKPTLLLCYETIWQQFKEEAKMADSVGYDPEKRPSRSKKTSKKIIDRYLAVEDLLLSSFDDSGVVYGDEGEIKINGAFATVAKENKLKTSTVHDTYYSFKSGSSYQN